MGETSVRQSDKLIIVIVQRDVFRLKDGPERGAEAWGLKRIEINLSLFDSEQENLIT